MNLIIDVGNTAAKLAVFSDNKLLEKRSCDLSELQIELQDLIKNYENLTNCILANVGRLGVEIVNDLKDQLDLIELNATTKVPFANEYLTPETLGVDRIALAAAAVHFFPSENCLIIDAGSCITYDFISEEKKYLGGAISPGIAMRYRAMNTFTAGLPLLEYNSVPPLVGNTTKLAIQSGVVNAVVFEIEGFISAYKANYSDLTVILTGGDAHFLRDSLKSDIFANSNFLLEGLNFILEHNKH